MLRSCPFPPSCVLRGLLAALAVLATLLHPAPGPVAALQAPGCAGGAATALEPFDLLLVGGQVLDGTGNP